MSVDRLNHRKNLLRFDRHIGNEIDFPIYEGLHDGTAYAGVKITEITAPSIREGQ